MATAPARASAKRVRGKPQTPRATTARRGRGPAARWARRYGVQLSLLRAPGIYAETRLPLDRIRQGTPVLRAEDDVFTNHIHADDLARAAVAAAFRGKPNRAYNISDDAELKLGGWLDAVADAFQPAAAAARVVGGGRSAHRADAAFVHERIQAARPTRG